MRTCQSCGKENPDDQDFCSCGEYLRWEPTGYMQAVTPELAAQALGEAPPPAAPEAPAAPAAPANGNGHAATPAPPPPPRSTAPVKAAAPPPPAAPIPAIPKTMVHGAVPPPQAPAPPASQESATIVLR